MARGDGAVVEDVDGNRVPRLRRRHCRQLHRPLPSRGGRRRSSIRRSKFLHMSGTDFYYEPQVRLARADGGDRAHSRTEAIVLRQLRAPRPSKPRSSWRAITRSATASSRFLGSVPRPDDGLAVADVEQGDAAEGIRSAGAGRRITRRTRTATAVRWAVSRRAAPPSAWTILEDQILVHLVSPDEVAAVVVEPIQGEGGYVVPPAVFHQRLRELTTEARHAADRRRGAVRHGPHRQDVRHRALRRRARHRHDGQGDRLGPAARRDASRAPSVMSWPPGAHASTFGGNPVSCAAALATIDLLRDALMKNAAEVGRHLLARPHDAEGQASAHRRRARQGADDRRRAGARSARPRSARPTERDAVVDAAFSRGLLMLGAGRNAIRLSPPLVLTKAQADTAVRIFDEGLTAVGTAGAGARLARVRARRRGLALRPGMTQARQALGDRRRGHSPAEALERRGYRILARRYRTRFGEIDIVARHGDCIVFVEVKTRRDGSFGDPAAAVTAQKQRRLTVMASRLPGAPSPGARAGALRRGRHHGGAARTRQGRRVRRRVSARLVRRGR